MQNKFTLNVKIVQVCFLVWNTLWMVYKKSLFGQINHFNSEFLNKNIWNQ